MYNDNICAHYTTYYNMTRAFPAYLSNNFIYKLKTISLYSWNFMSCYSSTIIIAAYSRVNKTDYKEILSGWLVISWIHSVWLLQYSRSAIAAGEQAAFSSV